MECSPDNRSLISANQDGTVHRIDIATGKIRNRLISYDDRVTAIGYAPSGN
ncbi:MAG: hypothetical protein M2R45_05446 [Verrucomicrobia subdivision 3 bacterium]|nr:hypothetical protein [Limisphaerales bacterium]MCS1417788.1 hypothetical protein [Limisphaerales bacterium]